LNEQTLINTSMKRAMMSLQGRLSDGLAQLLLLLLLARSAAKYTLATTFSSFNHDPQTGLYVGLCLYVFVCVPSTPCDLSAT